MFYQKLLAAKIYINKNFATAQPRLRGQVEANQPCYYNSVLMTARTKVQKLVSYGCKHNGTCKIKYYFYSIPKRI